MEGAAELNKVRGGVRADEVGPSARLEGSEKVPWVSSW